MILIDLPDHILISILSFSSLKSRLQLCSTCSKLRQLLFYPTVWSNFELDTDRYGKKRQLNCAESLQLFFPQVPSNSLKAVTWRLCHDHFGVLKLICSRNLELRYLQIVDENLENEDVEWLCLNLKSLEHIGITGTASVTGECLQYVEQLPRLLSFDFSYTSKISDEDFYNFLTRLRSNQLIRVNLDNVNALEDRSISLLLSKNCESLEYLNFDGENNSDAVFGEIHRCCKLISLTVNFAQALTDVTLRSLPASQKFKEICFRKGHGFSDEGLMEFLSRCCFSDLTVLNLSECGNLTNSSAVLIGAGCPNLTHLYLCWCWYVDDTGILPIVTRCNKMLEMDLTGLHILTGNPFLLIPETMPLLSLLKLEMCNNIQDEILTVVVMQMKGQLTIINYYHELIEYNVNSDSDVDQGEHASASGDECK